jgi:hypothetical protein
MKFNCELPTLLCQKTFCVKEHAAPACAAFLFGTSRSMSYQNELQCKAATMQSTRPGLLV